MLRQVRVLSRFFTTVRPYYDEHYQYPGNPTNEDYTQWANQDLKSYKQDTTLFKPKDQIEFNRVGELVLYEADVYKINPIYFPYPHCLPSLLIPLNLYMYLENPLGWLWNAESFFYWAAAFSAYPLFEYIHNLRYHINRLTLLRGGTVLKIDHSNISGLRWKTWIYIDEIHLLSQDKQTLLPEKGIDAKVVNDQGQLANDTFIQVENFIDVGRNMPDQILTLSKEGRVHHPDILSAVLRGFEIDTSNFRINTLHTERWFEPTVNN